MSPAGARQGVLEKRMTEKRLRNLPARPVMLVVDVVREGWTRERRAEPRLTSAAGPTIPVSRPVSDQGRAGSFSG